MTETQRGQQEPLPRNVSGRLVMLKGSYVALTLRTSAAMWSSSYQPESSNLHFNCLLLYMEMFGWTWLGLRSWLVF